MHRVREYVQDPQRVHVMTLPNCNEVQTFTAAAVGYKQSKTIPSMLSDDERALYLELARTKYDGTGVVIELGTWLGSGTFEICRGLDATNKSWLLTVLDRFEWNDFYHSHYAQPNLTSGDNFLPTFLDNLSEYNDKIKTIVGDLANIDNILPIHDKIQLLYVDAPKSWRMLWRVLVHLGPAFQLGTQIVFQDFFHITSRQIIWLAMSIPELRLTTTVSSGTSAVFEASGPLVSMKDRVPQDMKRVTTANLHALWHELHAALPTSRTAEIAVGLALDLIDRRALSEATEALTDGVVATSSKQTIIKELNRLIKKADKDKFKLMTIYNFIANDRSLESQI